MSALDALAASCALQITPPVGFEVEPRVAVVVDDGLTGRDYSDISFGPDRSATYTDILSGIAGNGKADLVLQSGGSAVWWMARGRTNTSAPGHDDSARDETETET